jgi:hypothetical protein
MHQDSRTTKLLSQRLTNETHDNDTMTYTLISLAACIAIGLMIEFHTLIPERNFPLPSSLETPHTEP